MGVRGRSAVALLGVILIAAACASRSGGPPAPQATEWTFGASPEHVALWYHGLAVVRSAVADQLEDAPVLPPFREGYAEAIGAAKAQAGAPETALDRRAAEFGQAFLDPSYDALEFIPLYFADSPALFSAIRLWDYAGGNPRNVPSSSGFQAVSFLASVFPDTAQRRLLNEWAVVLEEEARLFYRSHFERQFLMERQTARDVEAQWRTLRARLQNYLVSVNLHGGEAYLVPALGPEGRIIPRGAGDPRVALMAPPRDAPGEAVLSFVHEIMYPLVVDLVAAHPAAVEAIGQRPLTAIAAVRAGALILDEGVPELAEEYRRYYLRAAGQSIPAAGVEAAFSEAFPLPDAVDAALRAAVRNALAGPGG